jgi:hypothetical protein
MIDAIKFITLPVVLKGDTTLTEKVKSALNEKESRVKETELRRINFYRRIEKNKKYFQEFEAARDLSSIYLSDSINRNMSKIWEKWTSVEVNFDMHMMFLSQEDGANAGNFKSYSAVFSGETRKEFDALKDEILEEIRPIVQEYIRNYSDAQE